MVIAIIIVLWATSLLPEFMTALLFLDVYKRQVLLLGRQLVQNVPFLKKYTIPEPVAGGLLVALALLVLKKSMGWRCV